MQLREEMCYFLSLLNYALSVYKMLVINSPNAHTTLLVKIYRKFLHICNKCTRILNHS